MLKDFIKGTSIPIAFKVLSAGLTALLISTSTDQFLVHYYKLLTVGALFSLFGTLSVEHFVVYNEKGVVSSRETISETLNPLILVLVIILSVSSVFVDPIESLTVTIMTVGALLENSYSIRARMSLAHSRFIYSGTVCIILYSFGVFNIFGDSDISLILLIIAPFGYSFIEYMLDLLRYRKFSLQGRMFECFGKSFLLMPHKVSSWVYTSFLTFIFTIESHLWFSIKEWLWLAYIAGLIDFGFKAFATGIQPFLTRMPQKFIQNLIIIVLAIIFIAAMIINAFNSNLINILLVTINSTLLGLSNLITTRLYYFKNIFLQISLTTILPSFLFVSVVCFHGRHNGYSITQFLILSIVASFILISLRWRLLGRVERYA